MFTVVQLDGNMFCIVKRDALDEDCTSFKKLPFLVYGFLKVEGRNYLNSCVLYKNLSDEITSKELDGLSELAKLIFWNLDCHYIPR